ncbi:Pre-mRNA-splicing factor cwc26 [Ascosphaera acerosa]|nr:Pre-mRNA-splicing factor cwc26 [Ascosphaera acerosa]
MTLADYLAQHYLTADKPSTADGHGARPKKRKKRQHAAAEGGADGLIIADDDGDDLRRQPATAGVGGGGGQEFDPDDPSTYHLASAASAGGRVPRERRTTKKNWKTLTSDTASDPAAETERSTADAILASAAAEREAQSRAAEEETPVFADSGEEARMESGARGGLQTAEQTAALVAAQRRQREEDERAMRSSRKKAKKSRRGDDHGDGDGDGEPDPEQQTIYRDASGRIINVAMKRAEARRAAEEAARKEKAEQEAAGGLVQAREKERLREQLQEAKFMPLARTIEDEDLNRELRAQTRWDDPAAAFLTKARPARDAGGGASSGARDGTAGGKVYTGPFPPNRYGIRPGHRWDGVDRGNGYEKQWFAARNKKSMQETLEYTWQMDE